ncbi:hypothetical protein DCAR_0518580 [Daucus carota subsp. sativus]|uniref:EGF-like domain-containing protein n=1 Tax=Daucus carota subsp. sativus TaxID=79200 RepID=A0AAF0X0U3_DAUCS|nr:hypothetical protein DCAR_0518580 [Daucus carota subsp. sativus]
MGSCILKFSLSSTFKLFLLCFCCINIITTTSQNLLAPLQGLACAIVNCGEGTCRGSNETLLGIECDCNPGWKQIPAVSFAFPSCALPNCTVDFQCGNGAPLPPSPPLPPFNASNPCNLVWCGTGSCVANETSNSHSCQCNEGFANLFNNPSFACFEQCYLGADCKNLGLGPPPPPPSTSSGSPINGSNGASNNMKNFLALVLALVFLHNFSK